jgi:TPR repeat protein
VRLIPNTRLRLFLALLRVGGRNTPPSSGLVFAAALVLGAPLRVARLPAASPSIQLAATPAQVPDADQERWQALFDQEYALYMQKRYAEALPIAQEALRLAESTFGPEHPNVASSLHGVASIYLAQGKFAEAEPFYRRTLAIGVKVLGPDHPDVGRMQSSLARVLLEQNKNEEAEAPLRRALAIAEKNLRPDDKTLQGLYMDLAVLLRRMKREAEAQQAYARAKGIREKRGVQAVAPASKSRSETDVKIEIAYRKGDSATAVGLLRESAAKDSAFVKRYREAAAQGSAAAQGIVGVLYEEGIGVSTDRVEAIRWFRKAADQGDPTAQKYLGDMYRRGAGVPADRQEAMRWYYKAAIHGDGPAQAMMGLLYEKGLGILPDPVKAYMWYTLAISYFEGFEREKLTQVRARVTDGMSDVEIERAEQLARAWKPAAAEPTPQPVPGDLAWRAVELDDRLWVLDTMFVRSGGGTLHLDEEKVTVENSKEVMERLKRERQTLGDEMARAGFRTVDGDWELRPMVGKECKIPEQRSSELYGPVKLTQIKHDVRLKGELLTACGVIVGDVMVMRPRACEGTTPFRLVGVVTDGGIEMTFRDTSSGYQCGVGTLTRSSPHK